MSNPRPWSSNNYRSWCNHRWCMDSPTLGATPTTGAMGGPGDIAIMTTATMKSMDNTGAPTTGAVGTAGNNHAGHCFATHSRGECTLLRDAPPHGSRPLWGSGSVRTKNGGKGKTVAAHRGQEALLQ